MTLLFFLVLLHNHFVLRGTSGKNRARSICMHCDCVDSHVLTVSPEKEASVAQAIAAMTTILLATSKNDGHSSKSIVEKNMAATNSKEDAKLPSEADILRNPKK